MAGLRYVQVLLTLIESPEGDLLSLQWPAAPQNIFLVKKDGAPSVTEALKELIKYDITKVSI